MIYDLCFVTPDGASDDLILAALKGGATMIQLRDKTASDADMIAQAKRIKPECAARGVPLIINDRLHVALESGADGLHIGQSDGDPELIKKQLNKGQLLGLSIGARSQLSQMPICVDYIGTGPAWATTSKANAAAPIGVSGVAEIVAACRVPSLAIGGISAEKIVELKASKCTGIAVISAISQAEDPESATRELVTKWRSA